MHKTQVDLLFLHIFPFLMDDGNSGIFDDSARISGNWRYDLSLSPEGICRALKNENYQKWIRKIKQMFEIVRFFKNTSNPCKSYSRCIALQ
jgi:hypothetical protein